MMLPNDRPGVASTSRVVWTAVIAAVSWGAGCAVAGGRDADVIPVRVMSFNVRYGTAADGNDAWPRRRDAVVEVIREFDPDLLGMQEVLAFQREELTTALPGYGVVAAARDDGRDAGEMTPVFYRAARFENLATGHFWLSATPEARGSRGWDAELPRIATWVRLRDRSDPGGREVLILNTHFDHRGEEARRLSARLVRDKLAELGGGCRVVITGDFNAPEGSEAYRELFASVDGNGPILIDTLRAAVPRPGATEGTFSGFDRAATTGPRIDWIGCSSDWEVRLAGIDRTTKGGRTPSDHWPVTAVLRAARPDGDATLRVLTYNIHHGRGTDGRIDLSRLARVIRSADADLVALQEVDERTTRSGGVDEAAELARLTGLHAVFGPQIDYLGGRYGQALLARFPLGPPTVHELPAIGGDRERRIAVAAEVAHPHGRLTFVGTHLHHRSEAVRSAQARALVTALAAADRCILAGDINAVPGSEPLAILEEAWRRVAADAGPAPTFPAGQPVRAIDHVFVRPAAAFDVLDLRALDEPVASDHRPLLAVLGWRPADLPEVARWERDVAALEALDAREPDPADPVLFIGSSSIRLWDSIAADMAPWQVVRRGYGGARYRDLRHFASRLVVNHDPRALVVFVANDITAPHDAPPVVEVMVDVRATLAAIRAHHPEVPVFFVAVTPTESRWEAWPEISRLNAAIEAMTAAEPATFFIATAGRFLDPDSGRPIPALFRDDRLHLSQAGYAVWADLIASALDEVLAAVPTR